VHPSNYRVVGFTAEVPLRDLVKLANERGIEVMEDLGSGALIDLAAHGLPREPIVSDRVSTGAGIVTFSGDKLLGGPQAGILVGKRDLIAKVKRNPLKRALRCGKLTLAALSATLRLYLRAKDAAEAIPVLRLLRRETTELEQIGKLAISILSERLGDGFELEMVKSNCEIGSGAQPTEQLESRAIRISHADRSAEQIALIFRRASTPIIGRINHDRFHLDLRTVEDPAELAVEFRLDKPTET